MNPFPHPGPHFFFSLHRSQSKGFYLLNCTLKQRNMILQKGKHVSLSIVLTQCLCVAILFVIPVFHAFPRHVSDYLKVQERDPKAHKFLGQLYEREGDINKAVGCYKVKRTS